MRINKPNKDRITFEQLDNELPYFVLKSMKCLHNTANVIKCHFHRCYQAKLLQCRIFSHDCLAFSGKWLFPQIAELTKVRWVHYKHSHNRHHTLHLNDHQPVLALLHLNEHMLSYFFLPSVGVFMVMKEETECAHWTGHIKVLNQKITLCFIEMFTIKQN